MSGNNDTFEESATFGINRLRASGAVTDIVEVSGFNRSRDMERVPKFQK